MVWRVTRVARNALHTTHGAGACAGKGPIGAPPNAPGPWAACESVGCVDLFTDVWIPAHAAMHDQFPVIVDAFPDPAAAYLTTVARSELADLNRRRRAERGAVAKPGRKDGVVGRIAAGYDDPWLADVFRFLLGYVASPTSSRDRWPLDVLTCRKNDWDGAGRIVGSHRSRTELRRDVESCLAGVRSVGGTRWLYECLLAPLATSASHILPEEGDADHVSISPVWSREPDMAGDATSILEAMSRAIRAGTSAAEALREAVADWLGDGPIPPAWASTRKNDLAVRRLAKRLLADLAFCQEAA